MIAVVTSFVILLCPSFVEPASQKVITQPISSLPSFKTGGHQDFDRFLMRDMKFVKNSGAAVTCIHVFVKISYCFMHFLPSAQPNPAEVWPRFRWSFCFCCWNELTRFTLLYNTRCGLGLDISFLCGNLQPTCNWSLNIGCLLSLSIQCLDPLRL